MSRFAFAAVLIAATGVALAQPTLAVGQPTKPTTKAEPKKTETSASLKVGSKAPAIKADKWVKGTEVKSFEAGKVYVMEFWATWCGPCKRSIPHLTELQKSHKDVTVIGMASSEHKAKNATSDTRLDVLTKFVHDKGSEMDYTVAYDANGTMGKDWLRAAGQTGIPCAFVVDSEGKIAWIGNPLDQEAFVAAVDAAVKAAKPAVPAKTDSKSPAETPNPAPKPKG
jgi:thiol-disulfide isomerase/thioredoxin